MPARKVTENEAERISVTVDMADRVKLEHIAQTKGRSIAWVVRKAVREYLSKPPEQDHAEDG
jgi:predicted transcriptional regulator